MILVNIEEIDVFLCNITVPNIMTDALFIHHQASLKKRIDNAKFMKIRAIAIIVLFGNLREYSIN